MITPDLVISSRHYESLSTRFVKKQANCSTLYLSLLPSAPIQVGNRFAWLEWKMIKGSVPWIIWLEAEHMSPKMPMKVALLEAWIVRCSFAFVPRACLLETACPGGLWWKFVLRGVAGINALIKTNKKRMNSSIITNLISNLPLFGEYGYLPSFEADSSSHDRMTTVALSPEQI